MKSKAILKTALSCAALVCAGVAQGAAEWFVKVDPAVSRGPIRIMNAVNNGPAKVRSDQTRSNFDEFKALKIPYVRVHDANLCYAYGAPHTVDIAAVFPNFDADPDDPLSYDFTLTDEYLDNIVAAGSETFFRLGQSIEHMIKKYGVNPPKDFAKWAKICEHVVRHYNEGWGWNVRKEFYKDVVQYRDQFKIKYWEIWNEPDGNGVTRDGRQGPTWTGTQQQFLELYEVTAKHLRACFGDKIKIGGPAFCWWGAWKDVFVPYCRKNNVPLDFYSWHRYAVSPAQIGQDIRAARKLLDDNGFKNAESILNEWNYVKGWADEWVYSLEAESGRFGQKGAAFIAATMCVGQDAPLDMLMFYDARIGTGMNNMFNAITLLPMKGYYPFAAWRELSAMGEQVACTTETRDVKSPGDNQLYAVAAKGKDGRLGVFVVRYHDNNNLVDTRRVTLSLPKGRSFAKARCLLTDAVRTHTETPLILNADGTASVKMQPNSFAFIEVE